jgi:hypothetical protein
MTVWRIAQPGEVAAVVEVRQRSAGELEIGLVDERGRRQRGLAARPGELARGQPPQFGVNDRVGAFAGALIAAA